LKKGITLDMFEDDKKELKVEEFNGIYKPKINSQI
jgi:hypothetical protein